MDLNKLELDAMSRFQFSARYQFARVTTWFTTALSITLLTYGAWQFHWGVGVMVLGYLLSVITGTILQVQKDIGRREIEVFVLEEQQKYDAQDRAAHQNYASTRKGMN